MTGRSVPEIIGKRFGRLVVETETRMLSRRGRHYVCVCDCGGKAVAYGGHLRSGSKKSCGCVKGAPPKTHGMSRTPEFRAWESAKARCYLPTNQRYQHYGARGIKMCAAWVESFAAFFADMGRKPSARHSLDRLDNDGHYEPGNCRWATPEEQNNNRSINRHVDVNGDRLTVAQASRRTGIPHGTILSRLDAGESDQEAVRE